MLNDKLIVQSDQYQVSVFTYLKYTITCNIFNL